MESSWTEHLQNRYRTYINVVADVPTMACMSEDSRNIVSYADQPPRAL